jgi:hypothetical protein
MKSKAAKWPKYLSKVVEKGQYAKKGMVSYVPIYHDDWCKLLNGKGRCNCNPEVGEPQVMQ